MGKAPGDAVLLKYWNAHESPGILLKCRFWCSRAAVVRNSAVLRGPRMIQIVLLIRGINTLWKAQAREWENPDGHRRRNIVFSYNNMNVSLHPPLAVIQVIILSLKFEICYDFTPPHRGLLFSFFFFHLVQERLWE